MTKIDFFDVSEGVFTVTLVIFFIFFKPDIDPYAGKLLKDGLLYTIIDKILYAFMYIFVFGAFCVYYTHNKLKKVLLVFAMYSAVVTCEVLRLPLLEFPKEIVDRLEIYPYYGIALLIWSSIYIIDYFVDNKTNKKGEA